MFASSSLTLLVTQILNKAFILQSWIYIFLHFWHTLKYYASQALQQWMLQEQCRCSWKFPPSVTLNCTKAPDVWKNQLKHSLITFFYNRSVCSFFKGHALMKKKSCNNHQITGWLDCAVVYSLMWANSHVWVLLNKKKKRLL